MRYFSILRALGLAFLFITQNSFALEPNLDEGCRVITRENQFCEVTIHPDSVSHGKKVFGGASGSCGQGGEKSEEKYCTDEGLASVVDPHHPTLRIYNDRLYHGVLPSETFRSEDVWGCSLTTTTFQHGESTKCPIGPRSLGRSCDYFAQGVETVTDKICPKKEVAAPEIKKVVAKPPSKPVPPTSIYISRTPKPNIVAPVVETESQPTQESEREPAAIPVEVDFEKR